MIGTVIVLPRLRQGTAQPSYGSLLKAEAADLDSLKVYLIDVEMEQPEPAWSIDDAGQIAGLISQVEIDDEQSGFHCMCYGTYLFVFERDGKRALTLSYHHGESIRWLQGKWPGDGMLTEKARSRIPQWFADRGFNKLSEERNSMIAEQERIATEQQAFVSCFPEKVRQFFEDRQGPVLAGRRGEDAEAETGKEVARLMNDPVAVAVAVSKSLGVGNESWTMTTYKERVALSAARTVDGGSFLSALDSMIDDDVGLTGAARLFFYEQLGKHIDDEDARHRWAARLAEVTLQQSDDENKPSVLRQLWTGHHPQTVDLLLRVMRDETGTEIERKWTEEPGIRAGAALALAMLEEDEYRNEILALAAQLSEPSDLATVDVALAALGDHSRLKNEYALLHSYSIGLGLIKAIERFEGRHGMALLVAIVADHPWAGVSESAFYAFERITGQNWSSSKPRNIRVIRYSDELVAWWNEHGEEFVQSRAGGSD